MCQNRNQVRTARAYSRASEREDNKSFAAFGAALYAEVDEFIYTYLHRAKFYERVIQPSETEPKIAYKRPR